MTPASTAAGKHLVLIGGGHAHVVVVKSLGMQPEPGLVVTMIAKELDAPYSGMLPGLVAGHYEADECHIDLVRLANWAGVRLVHGAVTGIDRATRRVHIAGRAPLGYDLVSIDVGITPSLDGIAGAAEHALAVKPVSSFAPRWLELERKALSPDGPRRIGVIGAGAAGLELVLSMRHRLLTRAPAVGIEPGAFSFVLMGAGGLLPRHNAAARRLAHRELARQGVVLIENDAVVALEPGRALCRSGRTIPLDAALVASKAAPASWFKGCGLPVDEGGFVAVRPTLQLLDDDDAFAVGDCASVLEHPREKAGVFAVRQGPPLTENLRLRARGSAAVPFTPQKKFLTILAMGGQQAIAARGSWAISGGWVWRWKDRIDRPFMEKFNVLPPTSAGVGNQELDMRCAGCAAKVGPGPLSAALRRLEAEHAAAKPIAHDDAAVIDEGGAELRLETIDFFRAFWPEPYLFGEIAAQHAMNDIFAMGGRPTRALANVVLPYAKPARTAEDLYQFLAGARAAFDATGVQLAGGHSGEGPEMAAGFFVSGAVPRDAILRKGGLRPGDRIILARPIGTGVLLAAHTRGLARAREIAPMLSAMRVSNGPLAEVLRRHMATACTDVTGFGLAGHLLEMLDASRAGAVLDLAAIPLFGGALGYARSGVVSSLLEQNAVVRDGLAGDALADPATLALLLDPQTAGGLLAGVAAGKAEACVAALRAAGAGCAAIIGEVVAGDGAGTVLLDGRLEGQ